MKNQRSSLTALALCVLLCTLPAAGNDFRQGMAALEQGDVRTTLTIWRPLAEQGDPEAQFALGVLFNDAVGVPQDHAEANYWFLRAAEQGFAPAQYNLGNAYKYGTGMQADDAMAVIWWRKAADTGFAPAQYNLGSAYIEGSGVPQDHAEGLRWYRKAADNGHSMAKAYLEQQGTAPQLAAPAPAPGQVTATPSIETPRDSGSSPATGVSVSPMPIRTDAVDCRQWLAQGSQYSYTLQLMAAYEAHSAEKFLRSLQLMPAPVLCRYPGKRGTWHAVLYGQYPSGAAARAALAQLPANLREAGAYLRSLQNLREAVARQPDN